MEDGFTTRFFFIRLSRGAAGNWMARATGWRGQRRPFQFAVQTSLQLPFFSFVIESVFESVCSAWNKGPLNHSAASYLTEKSVIRLARPSWRQVRRGSTPGLLNGASSAFRVPALKAGFFQTPGHPQALYVSPILTLSPVQTALWLFRFRFTFLAPAFVLAWASVS